MIIQIRSRTIVRAVFQIFNVIEYVCFEAMMIVKSCIRFLTIFVKSLCQEMTMMRNYLYYQRLLSVQNLNRVKNILSL